MRLTIECRYSFMIKREVSACKLSKPIKTKLQVTDRVCLARMGMILNENVFLICKPERVKPFVIGCLCLPGLGTCFS